mgnify:CR=1 FL=1
MPLTGNVEWLLPDETTGILLGINKLPDASCGCASVNNDTKYAMESYLWETDPLYCRYVEYSTLEGVSGYSGSRIISYVQYADSYEISSTPGGVQRAFYFLEEPSANGTFYISTVERLQPVNDWVDVPQYPIDYTPGNENIDGYYSYNGFAGFNGYEDHPGYSGIDYYIGWSGYSGYSGYSGWADIISWSGYSGVNGYSGNSGYSSYTGSGYSGYSGWSMISGYSGHSGMSGYSGWSGYVDGTEFIGWSGYSEFQPVSGYSGYDAPPEGQRYCTPTGYAARPSVIPFDCIITATFNDLVDGSGHHYGLTTETKAVKLNVMGNWSSRALDCISNFPIEQFIPPGASGYSGFSSDSMKNFVPDTIVIKTPEEWQQYTANVIATGNTSQSWPDHTLMDSKEYSRYLLNHPDCRIKLKPC